MPVALGEQAGVQQPRPPRRPRRPGAARPRPSAPSSGTASWSTAAASATARAAAGEPRHPFPYRVAHAARHVEPVQRRRAHRTGAAGSTPRASATAPAAPGPPAAAPRPARAGAPPKSAVTSSRPGSPPRARASARRPAARAPRARGRARPRGARSARAHARRHLLAPVGQHDRHPGPAGSPAGTTGTRPSARRPSAGPPPPAPPGRARASTSPRPRNSRCRSAARSSSGSGGGGSTCASSGSRPRSAPATGDSAAPASSPPVARSASTSGPSGNGSLIWPGARRSGSAARPASGPGRQLGDQPGLADAGLALDDHHRGRQGSARRPAASSSSSRPTRTGETTRPATLSPSAIGTASAHLAHAAIIHTANAPKGLAGPVLVKCSHASDTPGGSRVRMMTGEPGDHEGTDAYSTPAGGTRVGSPRRGRSRARPYDHRAQSRRGHRAHPGRVVLHGPAGRVPRRGVLRPLHRRAGRR